MQQVSVCLHYFNDKCSKLGLEKKELKTVIGKADLLGMVGNNGSQYNTTDYEVSDIKSLGCLDQKKKLTHGMKQSSNKFHINLKHATEASNTGIPYQNTGLTLGCSASDQASCQYTGEGNRRWCKCLEPCYSSRRPKWSFRLLISIQSSLGHCVYLWIEPEDGKYLPVYICSLFMCHSHKTFFDNSLFGAVLWHKRLNLYLRHQHPIWAQSQQLCF